MKIIYDIVNFKLPQIVIFGAFFTGIFYFTSYNDGTNIKNDIKSIQTQVDQLKVQLRKKQDELVDVKNFKRDLLQEEETIKHLINFVPDSLTFTDISFLLIRAAKATGVNIDLKEDKIVRTQKDLDYSILEIQLKVNGSFSQILLFLSKLTEQKRMLIVKNIDMKINSSNRLIESDLLIVSYRYKKQDKETI